jgi:hypothetical protein
LLQQPVFLSPKFRAKSSQIFTQSQQNVTVVYEIDCLACKDEDFVNNPLDVEENDEYALDFSLHFPVCPEPACHSNTHVRLMFSSPNACLIIARPFVALFPEICTKFDTRCRIHREIASGQIQDRK